MTRRLFRETYGIELDRHVFHCWSAQGALQPPGGRLHVVWRQPLMWAGMIALACLVAGWVALALARQPRQTYGLIVLDDGIDEET